MENTDVKNQPDTNEEITSENKPGQSVNEQAEEQAAVKKAKEELAEARDKYLRLYSEFENFKRRTAREKLDMVQSANERLIKDLLPVIDDFERAEKSFKANSPEAEGFLLINTKFKKVLDMYGVKSMDIKKGDEFDPDLHEAIAQIPDTEELQGKIVEVVDKGYLQNDKVIRFAKVVVGN